MTDTSTAAVARLVESMRHLKLTRDGYLLSLHRSEFEGLLDTVEALARERDNIEDERVRFGWATRRLYGLLHGLVSAIDAIPSGPWPDGREEPGKDFWHAVAFAHEWSANAPGPSTVLAAADRATAEHARLQAQRDALLAAAKRLRDMDRSHLCRYEELCDGCAARNDLILAIKRAEQPADGGPA